MSALAGESIVRKRSQIGRRALEFEERSENRGHAIRSSVAEVLDLLNTKTVFLVLHECFSGTARFDDFVLRTRVSAPAVSRALKQLESAQIVERIPYQVPGMRSRDAYQLTAAGQALSPVITALTQWSNTYIRGDNPLRPSSMRHPGNL